MLQQIGGESACRILSSNLYARIAKDPLLRHLFPGKSLRCATEEFAAFLIQLLGGDETQTQKRWWLSLRESHARFQISATDRSVWLSHMHAAIESIEAPMEARDALHQFFEQTASYIQSRQDPKVDDPELEKRWSQQQALDRLVAAIAANHDDEAVALSKELNARPSILVGVFARMLKTSRYKLASFVVNEVRANPFLAQHRFAGRTLLHYAAAYGSLEAVATLLNVDPEPDVNDHGGHTPLYAVANECPSREGPSIVHALVNAGADPNKPQGQSGATPLHMAARRGHLEIARTLLDLGADARVQDRKGVTPLQRAKNCRRKEIETLLLGRLSRSSP